MNSNKIIILLGIVILIVLGAIIYSIGFYDLYGRKNTVTGSSQTYKIGVIYAGGVYEEAIRGLKDKLKEDGFVEGVNIKFNIKSVDGNMDSVSQASEEIMKDSPDLIYAISTPITTKAWQVLGNDIPIVFNIVGDPIGSGFAKDYKSSETNLTGCSNSSAELSGKRLETFIEAFPAIKKVVTIYNPDNTFSMLSISDTRNAAQILGIELGELQISNVEEIDTVLSQIQPGEYDGFYITPDATVVSKIDKVLARTRELMIPTMGHEESLAEKGVTITHGANFYQLGSQCASVVEAVLRGKEPRNIPVQTPKKLEIAVNEASCNELGLFPSPEIMGRADKIIK